MGFGVRQGWVQIPAQPLSVESWTKSLPCSLVGCQFVRRSQCREGSTVGVNKGYSRSSALFVLVDIWSFFLSQVMKPQQISDR